MSYEKYIRRQERLKALEKVLSAAKALVAEIGSDYKAKVQSPKTYALLNAIGEADALPPHDAKFLEKD